VRAVEPRSYFTAAVYVGSRRAPVVIVGVRDFARQEAEIVRVQSGSPPRSDQVLTEAQNASQGALGAGTGDVLRVIAGDGSERLLGVAGVGHNLNFGKDVVDGSMAYLYATVASLRGNAGYGSLAFRLTDTRPAAMTATIESVRSELAHVSGFSGFTGLPETRATGDWPGKDDFQQFSEFFYIVTVLALLSALVLIANTMTTLVAEQTSEIGIMKAVGGRRRQIAAVYVKTAMLLGTVGTAVGVVLGIVLSNVFVRFLGSGFFAVDVGFGSTQRSFSQAFSSACSVRRSRRCRRSGARCAYRSARRSRRLDRPSVARTPATGCCGACGSCRIRRRSAFATSAGAAGGASRLR
jgi:putative ABC transport system permease protein